MNNFGKVISILKEMDFVPDISSFEDRIILQKSMYLLSLKMDVGYTDWDLFLRGPYSPKLTEDMFEWWESLSELDQLKIKQIRIIRRAEKQILMDKKKKKSLEVMRTFDGW